VTWWQKFIVAAVGPLVATAREKEINRILKEIMATQADIAKLLADNTALLADIATSTAAAVIEIGKVGTETDTLLAKIKELQDIIAAGGTIGPELQAAADALAEQVSAVKKQSELAATAIKTVDDKVPDATP
jgi:hypothetical protein